MMNKSAESAPRSQSPFDSESASRRQILSVAGIGALALTLFTPGNAQANAALVEGYRNQIKILRRAKRKARRIPSARGRRIVIRNYTRAINTARRNLRQAKRNC